MKRLSLLLLCACASPEPAAEPPPAQAPEPAPEPREPGVSTRFYFIGEPMDRVCLLAEKQAPNRWEILPVLDLESGEDDTALGMQYTFVALAEGFLNVTEPGSHGLRLRSDDGSKLWLDGRLLIDHDGLHSPSSRDAEVDLAAGEHPFRIQSFQTYGGWALSLRWKRPGAEGFEVVPASALTCRAGERPTEGGAKRIIRPLERGAPGDGSEVAGLHPSLDLATVRPEGFEPKVGGIAWLPDGRMVLTTWDAVGGVYVLDGVQQDDRSKVTVKRFAAGLAEPLGICTVGERIFVLQKQELTELVDNDGDGVADLYRCVCASWPATSNFHEFTFGLVHRDGWLYLNLSTAILPGGKSAWPQAEHRGSTIRVRIEDGAWEVVAHGLRTPNGIGFGVDGEIFVSDNQGDWLPASKIVHVTPGAFFGSRSVLGEAAAKDLPVKLPVLWLPQDEIGNSPGNPELLPASFGPYAGQMVHPDVTHGGVKRDFVEKVEGGYQGCVFRWTQGLEAGVNRVSIGPDRALYAGGVGSVGNWGQEGKKRFGLQRLRYNGKPCFELLAVRARSNGFEVELTEAAAEGQGFDAEAWRIEQWRYVPTAEYGGPKVDLEVLKVRSASVSADRRRVFLEIDGLKEGSVVHLRMLEQLGAESGRELWTSEAWYTLNRVPKGLPGEILAAAPPPAQNALSAAERSAGWRLLFDGRTTRGWRAFRGQAAPPGWKVEEGALVRSAAAGDLATEEEFGDFELAFDWRIAPGGNSGVIYRATEDHAYAWETGPEYQILDNERFRYEVDPRTTAGANYALHAPPRDRTRPAGLWNQGRIVVRGARVEHWLNGAKLLEYGLWTPEWEGLVKESKFGAMPGYGRARRGRIVLQDHGDEVAFRNVRIRPLGGP